MRLRSAGEKMNEPEAIIEGELEEIARDTASEQYIFSIEGAWGLEDSPDCDGGPLRENGKAVGGTAGFESRRRWG